MSDISIFKKILEQPDAAGPGHVVPPKVIWLAAHEREPGLYVYHLGCKGWAVSKLFTFDLADARAAADQLAKIYCRPVKEYGPPAAFGRKAGP
jgi:hypothetical protein